MTTTVTTPVQNAAQSAVTDLPGTVQATQLGDSVTGHALSAWDLFIGADWVVQAVMLGLLLASFWSWTIIFAKHTRLRTLKQQATKFEEAFWSGQPLQNLYDSQAARSDDPLAMTFSAGMREWQRSPKTLRGEKSFPFQERVQRVMNLTMNRELDTLEKHMVFLASVGSTAPFVGLFGTVWGIMNSFQGIAMSQSTNLAVVAPGIAEALFATAIGLIAAIPAVLGYNKISTEINRYGTRLEGFVDEFVTIVSRKCEEAA
jgi:biopolymer transport protein TolQ